MLERMENLKIKINPTQFNELRDDPAFVQIIQLCRYLNQLLFCFQSYIDQQGKDENSARTVRQSLNSMFFIAGIMFEALKFCQKLEDHFADYESYKNEFIKILNDPVAIMISRKEANNRSSIAGDFQLQIYQSRNQVVFHVDEHPFRLLLEAKNSQNQYKFNLPEYVFLRGENTNVFDCYFDFADNLAVYWMIGLHDDDELEKQLLKEYTEKLTNFTKTFVTAGFNLVGEYANKMKWQINF